MKTLHHILFNFDGIQCLSNKHKFVDPLLVWLPWLFGRAKVDLLVNSMEYELGVALPMERQHPLEPVKIGRSFLQQVHHVAVKVRSVKVTLELNSDALDTIWARVGLLQHLILEEGFVDRKDGFHVKGVCLEDLFQWNT